MKGTRDLIFFQGSLTHITVYPFSQESFVSAAIKNKGSDLGSAQIQKNKTPPKNSKQDAWDKLEGQWVTDSRV